MNIRPHSTLHMISWCIGGGMLITALSLIMLGDDVASTLSASRTIIGIAGVVGFTAGIPFGVFEGVILNRMTRHIEPPYTVEMMKKHISPLIVLFLFPAILISFFFFPLAFGATQDVPTTVFYTGIIAIMAGFCSAFATRRYLLRLTIWSANQESRKSKEKNKNSLEASEGLKKKDIDHNIIEEEGRLSRQRKRRRELK